jgi:hypothetical protein
MELSQITFPRDSKIIGIAKLYGIALGIPNSSDSTIDSTHGICGIILESSGNVI